MKSQSGLTLIELLMAITLVGILSTVAISQYLDFTKDARIAVTKERLHELKRALIGDPRLVGNGQFLQPGYYSDMQGLPLTLDDLGSLPVGASDYDPVTKRGWRGPYVDTTNPDWKNDAWGQEILYSGAARTLTSKGPDGYENTPGDNIQVEF